MGITEFINVRTAADPEQKTSLWAENGRFIQAPENPATEVIDLEGMLVMPGLIETHIHLDKACILHRCQLHKGTLEEAIQETAKAKKTFDQEDIYQRGAKVLGQAIAQGTTHMRTHVEIDPVIGLTGFHAVQKLQRDFAHLITLEICVFPQEGMLNNPGTEALLVDALNQGAEVLGGCPYTDSNPNEQIERLFELACKFDRDLDFHLDFNLKPESSLLPKVIECTLAQQWSGRVTVGHVTTLSALNADALATIGEQLAKAGIAVTALPSTDLFLNGRDSESLVPRGVAPLHQLHPLGVRCSISSNNIANPFTPFGDASLVRQANLFANLAQLGSPSAFLQCLNWVSSESAKLLRLSDHGLAPGCKADFICFDVAKPEDIISGIVRPSRGFKAGKATFQQQKVEWQQPLPCHH